jgi:hypothetical protein
MAVTLPEAALERPAGPDVRATHARSGQRLLQCVRGWRREPASAHRITGSPDHRPGPPEAGDDDGAHERPGGRSKAGWLEGVLPAWLVKLAGFAGIMIVCISGLAGLAGVVIVGYMRRIAGRIAPQKGHDPGPVTGRAGTVLDGA